MGSSQPPSPPGTPRWGAFEPVTGLGFPASVAEARLGLHREEEEEEFDGGVGPLEAIALQAHEGTRKQKERFLLGLAAAVCGASGADFQAVLCPLVLDIAMDDDADLRQIVADQIGLAGPLCATKWWTSDGGESAGPQLLEFVDIFAQLSEDEFEEVQIAAEQALGALEPLLSWPEVEACVLPRVDKLVESKEGRLPAAWALAMVGTHMDEGMCQYLVLPMLTELSEDPEFHVRKAVPVSTVGII